MQAITKEETILNQELLYQPARNNNRFDERTDRQLRQTLFRSLAAQREDYLSLFFPHGPPTNPTEKWSLRTAQGAVDGAEYTAAAKGAACGHIFKSGESTYHCKTCAADDTCVLCAKCFEASNHDDHMVFISVSPGNSGCCDCGDHEAWRKEVKCTIHSADAPAQEQSKREGKEKAAVLGADLPTDLMEAVRMTIARAVDYLCDVFSCSPEQLRLQKTEDSIREDERLSRLSGAYGEDPTEDEPEFALILWNDEKHTVQDVENQIAKACHTRKSYGHEKAMEIDNVGRAIIHYSTDVGELLEMAETIEQLKLTVTIRSARDTFREQMCATIIDWIADIAGCSVGTDSSLLRSIVCEEFLKPWRTGSHAPNRDIGQEGIDDHEIEDNEKLRQHHRTLLSIPLQGMNVVLGFEEDDAGDDEENEEDDEVDYEMEIDVDEEEDEEDFEMVEPRFRNGIMPSGTPIADATMEMDRIDDDEEGPLEAMEATLAGYPPPPPPPPRAQVRNATPPDSDDGDADQRGRPATRAPYENVPKTPKAKTAGKRILRPSKHWLEKPEGFGGPRPAEPCEDLWQRVRLDFLILYDLRLWKTLRIDLRHLYITTVVTIPHFKRILGLRFAGLYTTLAQLYLIADREPDHSIINLSVQMLTTPTITHEVVERGNFLTNLMAILYTFLTTRQVGFPEDVSPRATLAFDAGAVANRRMFHFFVDLRWLFHSEFILNRVRVEPRYLLQFLDLVKLHQGICPNVRATAEHVEYESDAWISASPIVKEINKLCKQIAVAFEPKPQTGDENAHLQRAIRTVAQVAMINSFGYEKRRFVAAELKDDMAWQRIGPFEDSRKFYSLPRHVVQAEPMSFHHPLHYLLSWLIEAAKFTSRDVMRSLLHFSPEDLKDPWNATRSQPAPSTLTSDELLSSMFDHPLRVCVWLFQMKTGMWVRNGITLRHQAHTYRSVAHRDVGYQRDILMIQAGFVLCGSDSELPGERFLAQMIDRFQLSQWFQGRFSIIPGFEAAQQIDVIEDFFHLLVIALSERGNLIPPADDDGNDREQQDKVLQHDIAHALCFKPLSFSDLSARVTEKVGDSDDFDRVLHSMTTYRPPEGLNDTGTFQLKQEYLELVDPYYAHYSRNNREEAEQIVKKHIASKTGKAVEDVVCEPRLQPIPSGLFQHLNAFVSTPLFAQVIASALRFAVGAKTYAPKLPPTRIETFLHMVIHLVLIATIEDEESQRPDGFVKLAANPQDTRLASEPLSVVSALVTLSTMDEFASCHATVKHVLRKMQNKQPEKLSSIVGPAGILLDRAASGSPASLSADDKERKRQAALARNAKAMAKMKEAQNSFLQNARMSGLDESDSADNMSFTEEPANMDQQKTWNFPTGTCIWCQEETDEQRLYGTFAFLGESDILRTTPLRDPSFVQEIIDTPESLDRSADHIRPFGVSSQNLQTVKRVGTDGQVIDYERQGLSKGFPHQDHAIMGPVATGCGHIMHFSCFELYQNHCYRRHGQQIARNHPENTDLKEFTCPLCKALGNTFLPIIWKAKECAQEHELHAAKPFDDWLVQSSESYRARAIFSEPFSIATQMDQQMLASYCGRSLKYVQDMWHPTLAGMTNASFDNSAVQNAPESTPRPMPGRSFSLSRLVNRGRSDGSTSSTDSTGTSTTSELTQRVKDLTEAYRRINDTIRVNLLFAVGQNDETNMLPVGPLSRALGMSISAFEIAHRGASNDPFAKSLLSELSEQSVTHFRVLAETTQSYLAIKTMQQTAGTREAMKRKDKFAAQLLSSDTEGRFKHGFATVLTLEDTFLFFNDWLSFCSPDVAEATNVMQLCWWAEIVKAIAVYQDVFAEVHEDGLGTALDPATFTPPDGLPVPSENFFETALSIRASRAVYSSDQPCIDLIYKIAQKYALVFLRKCIVLMYVRYGLDYECPYTLSSELPEMERLTALLHLRPFEEMFALHMSTSPASNRLRILTQHWLEQAHLTAKPRSYSSLLHLSLSHPAIFELVGLPKNYDTLTEEALKHRCPSTGKELTDPVVCLLCGDIFCSQAVCCTKDRKGGCNQHMNNQHGGAGVKVGLFLNIRKCMVVFLHGPGNGSFVQAPYLDKHGEPDPTLRRRHQLFLNQRRYDKLMREVWLLHQIPTVISRKLEADVNPGGWDTF